MNLKQMTVKEITQYVLKQQSHLHNLPEEILLELKSDNRVAVKKLCLKVEAFNKQRVLEEERLDNLFKMERKYWAEGCPLVAGVDEAGRGPLAGPVVAAAVIFQQVEYIQGLNDSKKISEAKRYYLEPEIKKRALCYGIAVVDNTTIDEINISNAGFLAMREAIKNLKLEPRVVLIDGFNIPQLPFEQLAVIKGDQYCASIAAASILAKCARDRLMLQYHSRYPQYRFDLHKGYGTQAHYDALEIFGISPIHRKSFFRLR
jgi:ribonuclease HII